MYCEKGCGNVGRVPLLKLFLGGLCTITLGIYTYFLVLSLTPTRPAVTPANWVVVISQELNMRESPDTGAPVLKKLQLGQQVELVSEAENWFEVKDTQGQVGWIYRTSAAYSPPGLQ